MKFTIVFLIICSFYLSISYQFESLKRHKESGLRIPIKNNHEDEWKWITDYIAAIMTNSQTVQANSKLEVTLILLNQPIWNQVYEGFQYSLSKSLDETVMINSISLPRFNPVKKVDFVIILTTPQPVNYDQFVEYGIKVLFINRHTRFIIIIRNWYNRNEIAQLLWSHLYYNGYLNVYVALEVDHGLFYIYHTSLKKNMQITLSRIESHNANDKFMMMKDKMADIRLSVYILAFDSFPSSFVKNNKVLGVDGYLIDEFVRKLNTTYINVHSGDKNPSISMIFSYMTSSIDICLCAHYDIQHTDVESVWIYEIDGVCFMTPRNIYVSSYDNLSSGMDKPTIILAITSTFLVFISWKIVSMYSDQNHSTLQILSAVIRLALFNGVYDLNRMSIKEKFIVFSFIFASFFMSNLYESSILSFMMADTTVRSAMDIEELNDTDTKLFLYYNDKTVEFSNLPEIRKELILNEVKTDIESVTLNLPQDLDENLVYMVTCKFAENFVKSTRNYRNNRRLYDILILTQSYQHYTIRNGFMFSVEFSSLVTATLESGIRSYWTRETYRLSGDFSTVLRNDDNAGRNFIEFGDLAFPMVLLVIGTCLALLEFVAELVYHHVKLIQSKTSTNPQFYQIRKSFLNLHKWADKYSRKESRSFKISETLSSKEDVSKVIMRKKREIMKRVKFPEGKLKCGYLVPKKFKQRIRIRKVKVASVSIEINETKV